MFYEPGANHTLNSKRINGAALEMIMRDVLHGMHGFTNEVCRGSEMGRMEIIAVEEASKKLGCWRLTGCHLFVTLEPCLMCAGAIVSARLDSVFYGAIDPKAGAVESLYEVFSDPRLNHQPYFESGLLQDNCSKIISEFFRQKRLSSKS